MKAICGACGGYARQEQIGEYTFRCESCSAENDKNDLHHSVISKDDGSAMSDASTDGDGRTEGLPVLSRDPCLWWWLDGRAL